MISTLIQLGKITQKIEEIDKKLKAIQEDMLILKARSGVPPKDGWSNFTLGDK